MEKKISDLEYSEIAAAINGYLNSEASIKQYVLSDLGSEVETIRKTGKGMQVTNILENSKVYTMTYPIHVQHLKI